MIEIISLLLLIFTIFYIVYLIHKKKDISEKYNQMLDYVTKYEKIIDEQGKKNHEYNNQLMIIKGYINNKKKLDEYLSSVIDDYRTGQNYEIRQLSHFPNGGLKGLMYYKLSKMKDNNIKYYLYVSHDFDNSFEMLNTPMMKDVTKVFGVIIDNAIEGAIESNEKEIDLDFKVDDHYIIISITNSFNNTDYKNIGKKGYTTKGIGHGYGLSLVKDIVKRNRNIDITKDIDNNKFTQVILIDTKNQ